MVRSNNKIENITIEFTLNMDRLKAEIGKASYRTHWLAHELRIVQVRQTEIVKNLKAERRERRKKQRQHN